MTLDRPRSTAARQAMRGPKPTGNRDDPIGSWCGDPVETGGHIAGSPHSPPVAARLRGKFDTLVLRRGGVTPRDRARARTRREEESTPNRLLPATADCGWKRFDSQNVAV